MSDSNYKNFTNQQLKKKYSTLLIIALLVVILMVGLLGYHIYLIRTEENPPNYSLFIAIFMGPVAGSLTVWADKYGKELRSRKASDDQL